MVFTHNAFGATAAAFSVTTTNLSAGDTFQFSISAAGTFSVDCGTDGALSGTGVSGGTIIDRQNTTNNDTYTCTYSSGGVKTISFYDGYSATGYNTDSTVAAISFKNNTYVKELNGDLSTVFPEVGGQYPSFYETFSGCSNLITIPSTLFSNITTGVSYMFAQTFYGCTGLTTIPSDLFSGITTGADSMFGYTFGDCSGLTSIPSDLFSGITTGAFDMFNGTFAGCSGLTTIPSDLFSGITTGAGYMFGNTFAGCSGLTSIPSDLFSGITTGAEGMFEYTFDSCTGLTYLPDNLFSNITTAAELMFYGTFSDCTGLGTSSDISKQFIPPTLFDGLINAGSPQATYPGFNLNMMNSIFYNTNLVTQCPADYYQYITGYESDWDSKVSCAPCPSGSHSPAGATDISQCNQTITPTTYTVTYHSGNCHPEHQTDYTNTTHSVPDSVHPATGDTYTVNMDTSGTLLSPLFVEFNNMNFPTGNYDNCARFDYWVDDNGNNYSSSTNVSNPVVPTIAPYGSSDTNLYARCSWYPIEVGFYPGTCSGNVLREEKGTYGTSFSMPSVANTNISVPANYHFSGWSNNSNATSVDYEVDDTYTIDVCVYTNDKNDEPYIKFYAVCSPDTYNINYHNVLNSDTWTGNHPNTYTYGVGASVGVPSRTGYTFLGWCVNNSNCSNYANNVNGYTISTTDTGDVGLYAMWDCDTANGYDWNSNHTECILTPVSSTVNLKWFVNDQEYSSNQNSCEYGVGTISNIQHQEIPGWTFTGWKVTNLVGG